MFTTETPRDHLQWNPDTNRYDLHRHAKVDGEDNPDPDRFAEPTAEDLIHTDHICAGCNRQFSHFGRRCDPPRGYCSTECMLYNNLRMMKKLVDILCKDNYNPECCPTITEVRQEAYAALVEAHIRRPSLNK